MLSERPPLDVLRRMDAGAKDAWRRDRDVRLGRNYHPPGSPEHDANLMDFMEGAHPLFFKEPGVPRPMYHATNKDIRRFIPGGTAREEDMESGPATWLTFDPTNNPAAHHIGGYKGEYKEGTNIMPLYANIKNPLILDNKDALEAARNKFSIKSNAFPMLITKDTKNALQEAGHDGIVYQKEAGALDGDEVLAFDNHQLKSALGNRGVYDKQDPTVDYQRGGYISKAEGGSVDEPVEHDTPEADAEMQHEAMPLEYKESGFGLHQFVNNNIGFVGGTRTGKSGTEGTHRLGYAVYDTAHPSGKPTPVGKAELNFHPETNRIEGIVNLEFDKQHRGKGYGTRAVKALAASNQDGLQVYDIKKSAKPFWAKMGAEFRKGDPKNRELASKTNAVISHEVHKAGGGSITKAKGGAAEETVPEAPHTLESQLQAFLQGKRKAVLYTHEEPAPPEGAQRLETAHGVFHYNPALIDERSIKAAVAGDRINEILGYGPYSKKDVLDRVTAGDTPLAVVGRDAEGREVVAAAGTHGTANEQASAIAAQLPTGGQVHIESPQQVISERIAALRSPEQGNKDARKALMIARAMGGRIGKADGGGIDEEAPMPAPVTSGPKTVFAYGGKQYEFAVTPPDKQITSKDLAAQTTDALQQHLSLPYMQQVANS